MKSKTNLIILTSKLVILSFALLMSVACQSTSNISNDPRFANIVASGVRTKRELRLYPPGVAIFDSRDRYSLSAGEISTTANGWDYVATVPAHYPVHFDKLRRVHDISGGGEYLLGNLDFNGENYLISYWLGMLNDDSQAGWERFFKSFESDR